MKLKNLHEDDVDRGGQQAETADILHALTGFLKKKGFYVYSLLPWRGGDRVGYYLSVYADDKRQHRIVVSMESGSTEVVVADTTPTPNIYGVASIEVIHLADPDSFEKISDTVFKLLSRS